MKTKTLAAGTTRFSRFLRPDEAIVWTGSGGGSTDVQLMASLLVLGAIGAPVLAFLHFAVTPIAPSNALLVLMGCMASGGLVSALMRGRDNSKRDYVLTNQRLIVGNFDPTDATAIAVVHEADRASIQRLSVRNRSEYSAIRVETNNRGVRGTFLLLDQERPTEIAALIRETLATT